MAEQIMVCNHHHTPLIWTFRFAGAEYFCMAGNHAGGMLGTGYKTDATPELITKKKLFNNRWNQLKNHIVASRFQRRDCEKCTGDELHNNHLTDDEKRRSEMALKKLEQYAREES